MKSLAKKLQKDPAVMTEYHNIVKEQEQEGIIERVTKDQTDDNKERVHFLPITLSYESRQRPQKYAWCLMLH